MYLFCFLTVSLRPLLLLDRRHRENFLIEQNDWLARVNPNDGETLLDYLVKIQSP